MFNFCSIGIKSQKLMNTDLMIASAKVLRYTTFQDKTREGTAVCHTCFGVSWMVQ